MGIRGMESFLEKNDGPAYFPVNIEASIKNARRKGESTTIVVDGWSSCFQIYRNLPWIPGGQIKEFKENFEEFAEKFMSLGAELVFFFDGFPAEVKIDTWKKRRLERMNEITILLDRLNEGVPASSLEGNNFQVLPSNLCIPLIVDGIGCKVLQSIGDCDEEIARYAHKNNCLAILGQDTDFVIFPGAQHYWSMKHFNKHNMTTMEYSGRNLASMLHLRFEQLPLLATLLGNDVVQRELLTSFHQSVAGGCYNPRYSKFHQTVYNVADFIRRYPSGDDLTPHLRHLSYRVLRDESKWSLLQESLQSYNTSQEPEDDLENETGDEKWDEVLRLIRDIHINGATGELYGVTVRGTYCSSDSLEDYRLDDLPPNQVILKKLRQKIYGILLFEKPKVEDETHVVRELAMSGPGSLDDYVSVPIILPRVPHPGWVALWNNDDDATENMRWSLLCDAVNIDQRLVRDSGVPLRLATFLLSLKYLMDEGMKLQMFELNALISSAVILVDYDTKKLKRLPLDPVDTRGLRLYTLVTRAFSAMDFLNISCGYPISPQDAAVQNYQDGKLYQQAYRMAKSGSNISELCEHKTNHIEVFHAIFNILPVDKAVKTDAL